MIINMPVMLNIDKPIFVNHLRRLLRFCFIDSTFARVTQQGLGLDDRYKKKATRMDSL